jgi:hypothetical protein
MTLTITQGLGGTLLFTNFSPLAPSLVSENLRNFWELQRPTQMDTLASAYHHLTRAADAKTEVVEKVGQMIQRFESNSDPVAADNFTIGQLVLEWGRLKDSLGDFASGDSPALGAVRASPPPPRRTPVPATEGAKPVSAAIASRREQSIRFYSDGEGGFFPPSWLHFSDSMRQALKILAYSRKGGKMSDLTSDEGLHAEFLVGVLADWLGQIRGDLTETGVKGAGQSGLASAPSVMPTLGLVSEMMSLLRRPAGPESSLMTRFWKAYGAHADLRMTINRLFTMRSLQSILEEADRMVLEKVLYDLDVAYLSFLLDPLSGSTDEASATGSGRDESFGETLAKKLGDAMVALPMSERTKLEAGDHVTLAAAASALRTLGREIRSDESSAVIRGFLRKLLPSEMLRLASVVGMIQEHQPV